MKGKKKTKRNYEKEKQWQNKKYKKFGFSIKKEDGEKFIEILKEQDKTPLTWFKEQITLITTTVENKNTITVNENNTTTVVETKEERRRRLDRERKKRKRAEKRATLSLKTNQQVDF